MTDPHIHPLDEKYQTYLSDESGISGQADSISFPKSEAELQAICRKCFHSGVSVTIQGGKTGLVGGAVPDGGHILNLSRMDRIGDFRYSSKGCPELDVEAGVSLHDLNRIIRRLPHEMPLFWPVNPTETTATLGGIAACGAMGSLSYHYSGTKEHISAIRVLNADAEIREICRGEEMIEAFGVQIDLVDLFLGSEGRYGIITNVTVALSHRPESMWGVAFFFENEESLFRFAESVHAIRLKDKSAFIAAFEYMDEATLNLIESNKNQMQSISDLPPVPADTAGLLYLEIHGRSEDNVEMVAADLLELIEQVNADPDRSWAFMGDSEIEKFRAFRHAAPEAVNHFIQVQRREDMRITKLSSDMQIPDQTLRSAVSVYRQDLAEAGLAGCIFGHAGSSHLDVNILPANLAEYQRGYRQLEEWARKTIQSGGELFTEHGIGQIKKEIFQKAAPSRVLADYERLKARFDPGKRLNPALGLHQKTGG